MIQRSPLKYRSRHEAFTLVEVLVSSVLIVVIMGILLGVVTQTQKVWQKTSSAISQFQTSRTGFEAMTRRLSQATLNTYWKALDQNSVVLGNNSTRNFQFIRQSELQFLVGPTATIFGAPQRIKPPTDVEFEKLFPLHSMFFQAPLGYTDLPETAVDKKYSQMKYRQMDRMLMACGYYIEFGEDPNRPDFLDGGKGNVGPSRERFRLMELNVPSERLDIFYRNPALDKRIDPPSPAPNYTGKVQVLDESKKGYQPLLNASGNINASWLRPYWLNTEKERALYRDPANNEKFKYSNVLAENVVALIILPKVAKTNTSSRKSGGTTVTEGSTEAAPNYAFDSWRILGGVNAPDAKLPDVARDNLLPAMVQVTMVAIDEPSAIRLGAKSGDPKSIPDWGKDLNDQKLFEDSLKYADDLKKLEEKLVSLQMTYRVFSMDVVLRGSKWSKSEN